MLWKTPGLSKGLAKQSVREPRAVVDGKKSSEDSTHTHTDTQRLCKLMMRFFVNGRSECALHFEDASSYMGLIQWGNFSKIFRTSTRDKGIRRFQAHLPHSLSQALRHCRGVTVANLPLQQKLESPIPRAQAALLLPLPLPFPA